MLISMNADGSSDERSRASTKEKTLGSLMHSKSFQLESSKKLGAESKNTKNSFKDIYRLTKELGDGAFSVVYEAKNRKTNELVAVKVIKKRQLP